MREIPGSKKFLVNVWSDQNSRQCKDEVAKECPVALVYNDISHVVMMASPNHLESFSVGFSLSEGIVNSLDDIYSIEVNQIEAGIEVSLDISNQCFINLKDRRRSLAGRTGCGICGVESLENIRIPKKLISSDSHISGAVIDGAISQLKNHQPLQELTGSVHGAAWCDNNGKITELLEDVGRHNALDKLIGTLALNKELTREKLNSGFLLISSRASYEMVQKAAMANISVLVAVSAPTTLAIDVAESVDMTLIGFARKNRHVCYSHCRRLEPV